VSCSLSSNFRTLDPIARPLCQDDGQPFPNPVREGLPTIRKFARSVNTRAFTGTDRGLLRSVLGPWSPVPKCEAPGAPKSESSASKIFRHSDITLIFKATFEVFTRAGPDNSLERLTERSVGLVTDRPSDVYELFVTLL